jgi:hypothetical protein
MEICGREEKKVFKKNFHLKKERRRMKLRMTDAKK